MLVRTLMAGVAVVAISIAPAQCEDALFWDRSPTDQTVSAIREALGQILVRLEAEQPEFTTRYTVAEVNINRDGKSEFFVCLWPFGSYSDGCDTYLIQEQSGHWNLIGFFSPATGHIELLDSGSQGYRDISVRYGDSVMTYFWSGTKYVPSY